MNTRLYVRDSEFTERADQLRRGAQRLRAVRERVRGMIAADEELKRALDGQVPWDSEPELHVQPSSEDGNISPTILVVPRLCDFS